MHRSILLLAMVLLAIPGAWAQDRGPFVALAGQWAGAGTVELANGTTERLRCRAAYDVLQEGKNLQLNIRCASESYNFDLRGSADYAGGNITGTWSESTRNAAGTLIGRAQGRRIEVSARGTTSVGLTLTTQGDHQAVTIKSLEQDSTVRGASITLRRG